MEKLHISSKKARHMLLHGGNEVLLLTYPTVTGDTEAARHAAALVAALADYARESAKEIAVDALRAALAAGRVFDFTRHTYDVSLAKSTVGKHLVLALTAHFFAGEKTLARQTLTTYWDGDECLQYRAPRTGKRVFKRNI